MVFLSFFFFFLKGAGLVCLGFLGVFIYLGKMAMKDQTANLTTYLHAYIQFYQAFSILQVHINKTADFKTEEFASASRD